MSSAHWSPPDITGDILTAAHRPGLPEPVAVHVRPELHALMCGDGGHAVPARTEYLVLRSAGVPFVVDDQIPDVPGFEVHRAPPEEGT